MYSRGEEETSFEKCFNGDPSVAARITSQGIPGFEKKDRFLVFLT